MSKYIEVIAIVEGKTEQVFIQRVLAPYLGYKNIGMRVAQVSKPGQKGGDIRFSRVKDDLGRHLKQRSDTYITTFIDYYGIKEWPGLEFLSPQALPAQIAEKINEATKAQVISLFPAQNAVRRFIPFIAVHEFEALLFSDTKILARHLGISESKVVAVLTKCGSPEAINNSPQTAPSKRLHAWTPTGKFTKTSVGINIAKEIGIDKIRSKCPLFDAWLHIIEELQREDQ